MFGKKKKAKATPKVEIKLSPKVAKADELRKLAKRDGEKMRRIVQKWQEESKRQMSADERKRVDDKYSAQLEACERVYDKRYENYYNYVDENFTQKEIVAAGAHLGKFMDKSFINKLEDGRKRK